MCRANARGYFAPRLARATGPPPWISQYRNVKAMIVFSHTSAPNESSASALFNALLAPTSSTISTTACVVAPATSTPPVRRRSREWRVSAGRFVQGRRWCVPRATPSAAQARSTSASAEAVGKQQRDDDRHKQRQGRRPTALSPNVLDLLPSQDPEWRGRGLPVCVTCAPIGAACDECSGGADGCRPTAADSRNGPSSCWRSPS